MMKCFVQNECGQGMVEYGLILMLVALVVIGGQQRLSLIVDGICHPACLQQTADICKRSAYRDLPNTRIRLVVVCVLEER